MKQNKAIDVMVDIETTGLCHKSGILTIGACTVLFADYELFGDQTQSMFYQKIDPKQLESDGFILQRETMEWWEKQTFIIRNEAFSGTHKFEAVLQAFNHWLLGLGKINLWANPASFDLSLIKDAMDHYGIEPCWTHQDERCFRTMKKLFSTIKAPSLNISKHNALADARYQAAHLREIFNVIEGVGFKL